MNDDSADWILRRTTDYQFVERIAHIEERQINNEEIEKRIQEELGQHRETLSDISHQLKDISAMQAAHEPTLQSIEIILKGGLVIKWIIMFTVGALGTLAAAATAWDVVQKWWQK